MLAKRKVSGVPRLIWTPDIFGILFRFFKHLQSNMLSFVASRTAHAPSTTRCEWAGQFGATGWESTAAFSYSESDSHDTYTVGSMKNLRYKMASKPSNRDLVQTPTGTNTDRLPIFSYWNRSSQYPQTSRVTVSLERRPCAGRGVEYAPSCRFRNFFFFFGRD